MKQIAIDFGTTRTKVAMFDAGIGAPRLLNLGISVPWFIPSLFYIGPNNNILVGEDAQQALNRDPKGIVRGLKTQIHSDVKIRKNKQKIDRIELASMLFEWIKKKCEELVFHDEQISSCVITVPPPPSFDQYRIDCIKKAASLGGFEHIDIIEEPIAAARHWLIHNQTEDDFVFVCDIGGGTSDLALVKRTDNEYSIFPELPPRSLPKGGNDIDDKIGENMKTGDVPGSDFQAFLVKVKTAKEAFTTKIRKMKSVKFKLSGETFDVTEDIVNKASESFVETVRDFMVQFISEAEQKCGDTIRDVPILLVGGGYNIRGLKEAFEKIWPRVFVWEQSEFATVLGAISSTNKEASKEKTPEVLYAQELSKIIDEGELTDENVACLLEYADSIGISHIARKTMEIKILGHTIEEWQKKSESRKNAQDLFNKALNDWKSVRTKSEYESVAMLCDIVLKFDSNYWKAAYLSALSLFELKQYQKAEEILDIFLQKNSTAKELYFLRGVARHKEGQRLSKNGLHSDAYNDFMEALSIKDITLPEKMKSHINDFTLVHFFLASIEYTKNNLKDCRRFLQKYIEDIESHTTSGNNTDQLKLYFSKTILSMVLETLDLDKSINYSKEAFDILQGLVFEKNLGEEPASVILSYTVWNDWFCKMKTPTELLDFHKEYLFQSLMRKHNNSLSKATDDFIDLICNESQANYYKSNGNPLRKNKEFIIEIAGSLAKKKYNKRLDDLLEYLCINYKSISLLNILVKESALLQYLRLEKWKPKIMYHINYGVLNDSIEIMNASKYIISDIKISSKFYYKKDRMNPFYNHEHISTLSVNSSKSIPVDIPKCGVMGHKIDKVKITINFRHKELFPNCEIRESDSAEMTKILDVSLNPNTVVIHPNL